MNTVGKTVSVMGTVFILILIGSVGEVVAQRDRLWPPVELLKTKPQNEAEAMKAQMEEALGIHALVGGQTGLTLKEQPTQRGQHPKNLGCVKATFKVEVDAVRDDLKQGLFEKPAEYDSLIRFSKGKNNHDGQKDSFGMAIKVFEADDPDLPNKKNASIQDFVLSSNEVFFAPNPYLLLQFKKAERAGRKLFLDYPNPEYPKIPPIPTFTKSHDDEKLIPIDPELSIEEKDYQWFRKIVEQSHIYPDNILRQPYWSQTPYRIGTQKKVKYFVRHTTSRLECGLGPSLPRCKQPFFINDLRYFMQTDLDPDETKNDVTFDFMIQEWPEGGHSGITELPIEDPRLAWSTESELCTNPNCTKVATITIRPQSFLSPGKMAFCEQMSFTPWHALPEHKPLGGINKARQVVYELGSTMRHVVNQVPRKEPTWQEYKLVEEYDENLENRSQGWSRKEQGKYYHTAQGTAVVPFAWFLALERMDLLGKAEVPFLDDANILRYGFLPDPSNRYGLPVGFTKSNYEDPQNRHTWVDITCAACHTGQLKYHGKIIRIDGAPSMQWNRPFLTALAGALKETLERPEKFSRFSDEVRQIMFKLGLSELRKNFQNISHINKKETRQNKLKDALTLFKSQLRIQVRQYMNELIRLKVTETKKNIFPTDWGHGRIDALGRGGNTFLAALHSKNVEQANAPVSIPKIWDAWKYDWVQWNGSLMQPTGRNIAQVVGVGARTILEYVDPEVDPEDEPSKGFKKSHQTPKSESQDLDEDKELYIQTSIDLKKIVAMEEQLRKLKAPTWPGKLFVERTQEQKLTDEKLAAKGKALYSSHCAECHVPDYVDPTKPPDYGLEPYKMTVKSVRSIGTDPKTANNFNARRVKTGELEKFFKGEMLPPAQIIEDLTTELRSWLLDELIKEITIKDMGWCKSRRVKPEDCYDRELIKQICVPGAECLDVKRDVQSIHIKLGESQVDNQEKLEKEIKLVHKKLEQHQMAKLGKEFDGIHAGSIKSQEGPSTELVKVWNEKKEQLNDLKEKKKSTLITIREKIKRLKGQLDGKCETNLLLMDDGTRKRVENPINRNMILKRESLEEEDERLKRQKKYAVCVFLALVEQDLGRKNEVRDNEVYIARTNAGVWATAPFLHNGSVPNIYQLLSPVKDRAEKFCLGKADFDPIHVGFDVRTPPCIPFGESEFDTTISGNSNKGHEFRNMTDEEKKEGYSCSNPDHSPAGVLGCEFEPEERLELIEYLKTSDCEFLTLDCTGSGFVNIPMPEQSARRDESESTVAPSTASKIVQHLGIHNENRVKARQTNRVQ